MARWKQVDELLKEFVNGFINDKTCNYKLDERGYNECYEFCCKNVKNHSFLDTDEKKVQRTIEGTIEKLVVHGLELKSQQLEKQCHRFLTSALYGEEILHEKTQTHYSILNFLFLSSQSPTSTNINIHESFPETNENQLITAQPFDWKSYLLDDEDVILNYSSSSSEEDDDALDDNDQYLYSVYNYKKDDGENVLITPNNDNIKWKKMETDEGTKDFEKLCVDSIKKDSTQNKKENKDSEVKNNIEKSLNPYYIDHSLEKLEILKANLNDKLTKTYWMAYGDYSFCQSIPHTANNILNSKDNINGSKSLNHKKFNSIEITSYENDYDSSYCFDLQNISVSLFIDEGFNESFKISSQLSNNYLSNNGVLYNFNLDDDHDGQYTSNDDTALDVHTYKQHKTTIPLLYQLNDYYINNDKLGSFCNKHVLSEDNLISEIIWLFTGLTTTFTFKWINSKYVINNCVAVNFLGQKCLHKVLQEYALHATMMKNLQLFIEALIYPNNLPHFLQNHHYSQWDFNDMEFVLKFQPITNTHQAFASVVSDWLNLVKRTFLNVDKSLKNKRKKSIMGLMVELKKVFKVLEILHNLLEYGVVKPLVEHLSHMRQQMINQEADNNNKNNNDLCNQITQLNCSYTPTQSCLHLLSCVYTTLIQCDLLDFGWNEAVEDSIDDALNNEGFSIRNVSELQLLASVWLEVVRPCLQLVDDWLRKGIFDDHLDEFFIKKTKYWEERNETFWEKSLELVGSQEEHAFLMKSLNLLVNTVKSFGLIGSINEMETTNTALMDGVESGISGESLYDIYKCSLLTHVSSDNFNQDELIHENASSDELQLHHKIQKVRGSSAVCDGNPSLLPLPRPSSPQPSTLQQPSSPSQQPSSSPQQPSSSPQPSSPSQQPSSPPQPSSSPQQPSSSPQPSSLSQQPSSPPQTSSPSQQPSSPPQPSLPLPPPLSYWDEDMFHTFIKEQSTDNNPHLTYCLNKSLSHFALLEPSLDTISIKCSVTELKKPSTKTNRHNRMHLRHRLLEQVIKDFTARCYTAISRTITASVALNRRFLKHFTIVKKCFLMESGRFMHDFYCSLFNAMETEIHWYEECYLTFLLHQAFMDEQCGGADDDDDDDDDMLSRLSISMDVNEGEVRNKDINFISQLSLKYQVPWPCNIMLSKENMKKYEDIFKFIMMLKYAKYSLDSLHFVEIKVPRDNKVCRDLVHRLQLFRMKVLNFANSFDFYVMTRIIESSSVSFEKQMHKCEGIQGLIHLHQHYLDLLYNRCLLKQKTSFLKDLIVRVLQISLDIYHLWVDFSKDAMCEDGSDVFFCEEDFVKKFEGFSTKEKEFSRCVKFLSSTVNQVIIRGSFPYLESLAFTLSSCTESCQDKLFTDTDH